MITNACYEIPMTFQVKNTSLLYEIEGGNEEHYFEAIADTFEEVKHKIGRFCDQKSDDKNIYYASSITIYD